MGKKMSDKIDFVDLTDDKKELDKDKLVTQLSHVIFTDCGKAAVIFGLDTDDVATALLAAAESMLWFSKIAARIDDEGTQKIREKALEMSVKRQEYFKESGLEEVIANAFKMTEKMKSKTECCGECSDKKDKEENDD
jgi:hypothetical protein